jgi:HEAT repeat protein
VKGIVFATWLSFAGLSLGMQNTYRPPDFTTVDGDSIKTRYENAVSQGRQGNTDTFWVAYGMPHRNNVRTSSADGIEVVQSVASNRASMFLMVRKSDGMVERVRIVDLDQDVRVHDRRVYWLGTPGSDDSATLLLSIARSPVSMQVKKDAIFWLGQEISRLAGSGLETIATDDPEVEVQKQAVFALSLHNDGDSLRVLMRLAKEHPNFAVRQQAIFWLSQKRDPIVLDFFEQLLRK